MTRMHHTMSGNGEEVYRVLVNGINGLIVELCREARVNTQDIHAMTVGGNTVMSTSFWDSISARSPWTLLCPWSGTRGSSQVRSCSLL
jgi:uncharacterized 2Fe-2S/4Fe-4S cluster protein (DUF4445 family)